MLGTTSASCQNFSSVAKVSSWVVLCGCSLCDGDLFQSLDRCSTSSRWLKTQSSTQVLLHPLFFLRRAIRLRHVSIQCLYFDPSFFGPRNFFKKWPLSLTSFSLLRWLAPIFKLLYPVPRLLPIFLFFWMPSALLVLSFNSLCSA